MEQDIKKLAYLVKKSKEQENGSIVFLGAGASCSGNIPLGGKVVEDILSRYSDSPYIEALNDEDKKSYTKVMECLQPDERKELFSEYVGNSKVNVTHVYLANIIKHGFVDYVLTTNFDDLILRGLGLYNIYPPVYDLATLDKLGTGSIDKKTVVYLHGRHNGLWQLNTSEEMEKIREICQSLFNKISDRPWIVLGYSGNDSIFEYMCRLGRFSKGLYWVSHPGGKLEKHVRKNLINNTNCGATLIEGYDADTFMIKLHNQLNIDEHPVIFNKPFTALKTLIDGIVDIDDKNNDEFKTVKERFEISKNDVADAIKRYEENIEQEEQSEEDIKINNLRKEIINIIVSENFEENKIKEVEQKVKSLPKTDNDLNILLSGLNGNWGNALLNLAKLKHDEALFMQSCELYKKATELNPDNHAIYNNWGIALGDLANLKNDEELFMQSGELYKKAAELNPNSHDIYNNWGVALGNLAKLKNDEALFMQSCELYKKAAELNPNNHDIYNNWGVALGNLAKLKNDEALFMQSCELYKKAAELNPNDSNIYNNWGNALTYLATLKNDEALFMQSCELYKKAAELNPNDSNIYNNWGIALGNLAKLKNDEALFMQSYEKLKKAADLNGEFYNLACWYALTGQVDEAFAYLGKSLANNEIGGKHVREDEDLISLRNDPRYSDLLSKYLT